MEKQEKFNSNLVQGIFFMLIGVGLAVYAIVSYSNSFNKDWAQSPYLFPIVVAIFICMLSIGLIIRGRKQEIENNESNGEVKVKKNIKGIVTIIVISLLYFTALSKLSMPMIIINFNSFNIYLSTFELSTVIFIFVFLFYLGVRKAVVLTAVPISVVLFLSISFRTLLNVLLP